MTARAPFLDDPCPDWVRISPHLCDPFIMPNPAGRGAGTHKPFVVFREKSGNFGVYAGYDGEMRRQYRRIKAFLTRELAQEACAILTAGGTLPPPPKAPAKTREKAAIRTSVYCLRSGLWVLKRIKNGEIRTVGKYATREEADAARLQVLAGRLDAPPPGKHGGKRK